MSSDREVWDRGTWPVHLMVARRHREIRLRSEVSIVGTGDRTQDLIRNWKKMMATALLSLQPLCLHSLFLSAPSVRGIAVFLCLWVKLLLFFPGDIYFCQKHLLSLDSNATEASWALFSPLSLLSNDPFCQSKQFAIKPPPPASLCFFS